MSSPGRIISSEVEWGLRLYDNEGEITDKQVVSKEFRMFLPEDIVAHDRHLSNGGALIIDFGGHPEYSAPEFATIEDAVTGEIAGEGIANNTMGNLVANTSVLGGFRHNKRVRDHVGNTWGYHENYGSAVHLLHIDEDALGTLALHLATRNLYTGAGFVDHDNQDRPIFRISQKQLNVNVDFSEATTGEEHKAVVNLRNEPLADQNRFIRLHVTSGDAHMSPWAMRMTFGTTSLVIKLIERGYDVDHMAPKYYYAYLAKLVARDVSMTTKYTTRKGESVLPLDAQESLLEKAEQLNSDGMLTEEEQWVLDEWRHTIDTLRADPTALVSRCEWMLKQSFIDKHIERLEADGASAKQIIDSARFVDMLWDEFSSEGIGLKLRSSIWKPWMPQQEAIDYLTINPPQNTRARVRGLIVKNHAQSINSMSWDYLKFGSSSILLPDPHQSELGSLV